MRWALSEFPIFGKKIDDGLEESFIKDFIKEKNVELTNRQLIIFELIASDSTITSENTNILHPSNDAAAQRLKSV